MRIFLCFNFFYIPLFCSNVFVALTSDYEMWSSTDIPINEELLQYRATESYTKKDSQQVNLTEGQTVSVIDRCDTGKKNAPENVHL